MGALWHRSRRGKGSLPGVPLGRGTCAWSLGCSLLTIRARTADVESVSGWLSVPGEFVLPGGRSLVARMTDVPPTGDLPAFAREHALGRSGRSVLLDAELCGVDSVLGGRLWVDMPHPGDVLCPLGMHGQSKKLSDLLGEARIPVADRAFVPVVHASPTGSVLWVAGIRADERVRCLPTTHYLLELDIRTA